MVECPPVTTSTPSRVTEVMFAMELVMTAPAFISEPVPTMVSTQPTGSSWQSGSSKRR